MDFNEIIAIEIEEDDYDDKYDYDEESYEKLQIEQLNNSNIDIIEISPNGKYIVAYSKEIETIVWWIKDSGNKNEGQDIKGDGDNKDIKECNYTPGKHVKTYDDTISSICVSDQMKLAYIDNYYISKYYREPKNKYYWSDIFT